MCSVPGMKKSSAIPLVVAIIVLCVFLDTPRAQVFSETGNQQVLSSPSADRGKRPAYKKGELLVRFKKGATPEQIAALHAKLGSVVIKTIPRPRVQRIKLKAGFSEVDLLNKYRESGIVEHVERHALRYPQATPDDPDFSVQWGLKQIKADALWDITTGSRDVIVAVIDSGVDYTHPDLTGNIWINTAEQNGLPGIDDDGNGYIDDIRGWDFADNDNDPFDPSGPWDYFDHGTHVAGIIGAAGNNGIGVSGVNWKIRIIPLKVKTDSDKEFTLEAILEAIEYAIANGAQVVNCSFGGEGYSGDEYAAFASLREKGILAVCGAGNDSYDMDIAEKIYPACYDLDNILSVGSSNETDTLADSSNYGEKTVDVAAPGNSIYSTLPGSAYGYMNGTSVATPHVTGLAGLIFGQCPSAAYTDVRASIISNVDRILSLAGRIASGGRINALAARTAMTLPGDISGDCLADATDAALALRILSGQDASFPCPLSSCKFDVNGDNLIGHEEAIYILQKLSGSR